MAKDADNDEAGFAARALPDVVFTNVLGMLSAGKPPFVAQHERIFSTIYKVSTSHLSIQHITFLKPDVAVNPAATTMWRAMGR